jgi:hypothetical protein
MIVIKIINGILKSNEDALKEKIYISFQNILNERFVEMTEILYELPRHFETMDTFSQCFSKKQLHQDLTYIRLGNKFKRCVDLFYEYIQEADPDTINKFENILFEVTPHENKSAKFLMKIQRYGGNLDGNLRGGRKEYDVINGKIPIAPSEQKDFDYVNIRGVGISGFISSLLKQIDNPNDPGKMNSSTKDMMILLNTLYSSNITLLVVVLSKLMGEIYGIDEIDYTSADGMNISDINSQSSEINNKKDALSEEKKTAKIFIENILSQENAPETIFEEFVKQINDQQEASPDGEEIYKNALNDIYEKTHLDFTRMINKKIQKVQDYINLNNYVPSIPTKKPLNETYPDANQTNVLPLTSSGGANNELDGNNEPEQTVPDASLIDLANKVITDLKLERDKFMDNPTDDKGKITQIVDMKNLEKGYDTELNKSGFNDIIDTFKKKYEQLAEKNVDIAKTFSKNIAITASDEATKFAEAAKPQIKEISKQVGTKIKQMSDESNKDISKHIASSFFGGDTKKKSLNHENVQMKGEMKGGMKSTDFIKLHAKGANIAESVKKYGDKIGKAIKRSEGVGKISALFSADSLSQGIGTISSMSSAGILFMEPYINLATGSMNMIGSQAQNFTPSKLDTQAENKNLSEKINAIHYNIEKIRNIILSFFTEYEPYITDDLYAYKTAVESSLKLLKTEAYANTDNPAKEKDEPIIKESNSIQRFLTGTKKHETPTVIPNQTATTIAEAYYKLIAAVKNKIASSLEKRRKTAEAEETKEYSEVAKIVSNIDKKSLSKTEERVTALCSILKSCDTIIFQYNKLFPEGEATYESLDLKKNYKLLMKESASLQKEVNNSKQMLTGSFSVMNGGTMRGTMRGGGETGSSDDTITMTPDGEKFIKYSVILYLNKYPDSTVAECKWFIDRLFLVFYTSNSSDFAKLFLGVDKRFKKSQEEVNTETDNIINRLPPLSITPNNTQKVEQKKRNYRKVRRTRVKAFGKYTYV